jgi:hypothetical protein
MRDICDVCCPYARITESSTGQTSATAGSGSRTTSCACHLLAIPQMVAFLLGLRTPRGQVRVRNHSFHKRRCHSPIKTSQGRPAFISLLSTLLLGLQCVSEEENAMREAGCPSKSTEALCRREHCLSLLQSVYALSRHLCVSVPNRNA